MVNFGEGQYGFMLGKSDWYSWRKITGVLCDKRVPEKVKGKMYKTIVQPAMLYGMEAVAMTKSQERKMEVAEMKMLRFPLGVTRVNRLRNEEIRERLGVTELEANLREARLRWMSMCTEGRTTMLEKEWKD